MASVKAAVKVEEHDGSYDCLLCSESVRGAEARHCSACTVQPWHVECGPTLIACPQCARDNTVVPWKRRRPALPSVAMYGAGKRKRARAGSAGSEGDPLSPLDAKRAPIWAGEHDSFMFSPTLSPFPECTATEERHGSMMRCGLAKARNARCPDRSCKRVKTKKARAPPKGGAPAPAPGPAGAAPGAIAGVPGGARPSDGGGGGAAAPAAVSGPLAGSQMALNFFGGSPAHATVGAPVGESGAYASGQMGKLIIKAGQAMVDAAREKGEDVTSPPGFGTVKIFGRRPPTPRDGSGRPPTPRGNSLGEGCRPATPYVPSLSRELSAVRERAHSTSRAGLREGSLDRSAFLESPDRLRSELLEVSSTSALNQSRAYHLEESLVLAKSRSERYERELVSEMDRSCALAGKAARLEEANSALKEELSAAQAKAGAQERRVLALEAQAAAAARNIPSISAAEAVPADPGATSSSEQLHTAQTALLHAQRDLALANIAAEDAKSECTRLAQRLQAAEQRAEEASAARAPAQAGGGETVVSATDPQHGSCCCKFCLCASAKPPPPMAVLRTHRARPSVCPRVSLLHVLSLLSALCASNVFRRSSRRR